MSAKTGILLLLLWLAAAGCATPAAPVATPAPATAALSTKDALVVVDRFYDLFITQQDYGGALKLFDAKMSAALPENKLKEIWDTLPKQVGAFQHRSEARLADHKAPYQQVIVPLQFEKMALNMLVVVDLTTGQISGLFFQPDQSAQAQQYQTPAYADPAQFTETDVTIGAEPWQLPGTLTLPNGVSPFPAVVLVHGSGPNDRDETLGPNKPFKDIAQGLASQGIAVLRYDKRTKVYPQEMMQIKDFTVKDETIDDAVAGVEFLRRQPRIDPQRVFVLGHSLGGYLAPRVAQAAADSAGLIILAGATRPLEDLMLEQTRYILGSDGSVSNEDQAQLDQLRQQVAAVKALTASDAGRGLLLGAPASYWIDLKDYQPAEVARSLTLPLLIMQGERDYQVTMQDFQNWQNALAGKTNVTLKTYPDLNHLFMSGSGPSTPTEYQAPGNVAPKIIQDIVQWLQQQN